jgi:hypothetical protein
MVAMAEAGGAMWKKWEKRGWHAQTDLAKNEWGGRGILDPLPQGEVCLRLSLSCGRG